MKLSTKRLLPLVAILTLNQASQAIVIAEFLPSPDGQEYMIIRNTTSATVNLMDYTWSNDGTTFQSITANQINLAVNEYALIARQSIGGFIGSYSAAPLSEVEHFVTNTSLDFQTGIQAIQIQGPSSYSYTVNYDFNEANPYDGSCIVNNAGPEPTVSTGESFSTVPEPSTALLSMVGLGWTLIRRRR